MRASVAPNVSSGLSPSLNSADLPYSSDVIDSSASVLALLAANSRRIGGSTCPHQPAAR